MKKILLVLLLISSFAFADAIPIKNPDPTHASMTRQEVFWIYTLRTRFWNNGTKITVFYLDFSNPTHERFVRNVLNSTTQQFQHSVNTYVNVGNAGYFRKVSSESEMLKQVSRIPGSVGYISDTTILINSGKNNVKEISITD